MSFCLWLPYFTKSNERKQKSALLMFHQVILLLHVHVDSLKVIGTRLMMLIT